MTAYLPTWNLPPGDAHPQASSVVGARNNPRWRLTRMGVWCLVLAIACSVWMLLPVLLHAGWPANHDWIAPVMRMATIAEQWKLGHLIPTWSTRLQYEHGSPMPILYHKTFMYSGAAVLWLTGSPKVAIVVPLFASMVLAFGGMAVCLRQALGRKESWLWMLGGALFLTSNYATTDWLIRGAFAEFCALSLLPLVFAWCLKLIMEGHWARWIGPLLAALALSHSTLALFVTIPLVLAGGLAVWRWRAGALAWLRPAATSAAVCIALMLPFVLPMLSAARFNRIEELVRHQGFTPMTHLYPLSRFAFDPAWRWGLDWNGFTVQLDSAALILTLLFCLTGVIPLLLRNRRTRLHSSSGGLAAQEAASDASWRPDPLVSAFLLSSFAAFLWLQTRQAFWVYEHVPGLIYLQFAWRLLAYLSVIVVICGVLGLATLLPGRAALGSGAGRRQRALVVALGCVALGATAEPKAPWHAPTYEWITAARLQSGLTEDYVAMAEFFPLVDWQPHVDIQVIFDQTIQLLAIPQHGHCRKEGPDVDRSRERSAASWEFTCSEASADVRLPVFAALGMKVDVRPVGTSDWTRVPLLRTCADPRLQIALPAGSNEVRVRFPNWWGSVQSAFVTQPFDFRRDCTLHPDAVRIAGGTR